MYTQCPDCQTAFRVTAQVLQQAAGRVRCGGCGNAFNAIDHLSEVSPKRSAPGIKTTKVAVVAAGESSAKNKDLLKELEQLAGDDGVRIEDTGIEWRVVDDDENSDDEIRYQDSGIVERLKDPGDAANPFLEEHAQTSLGLRAPNQSAPNFEERRYDDNTPLPDDFDDEDTGLQYQLPQRRQTDVEPANVDSDKQQIDLLLGNDDDWADLLDADDIGHGSSASDLKPGDAGTANRRAADQYEVLPELAPDKSGDFNTGRSSSSSFSIEVEEELAAIHSDLTASAASLSRDIVRDLDRTAEAEMNVEDDIDELNLSDFESSEIIVEISDGEIEFSGSWATYGSVASASRSGPLTDEFVIAGNEAAEVVQTANVDDQKPEVFEDEPDARVWVDSGLGALDDPDDGIDDVLYDEKERAADTVIAPSGEDEGEGIEVVEEIVLPSEILADSEDDSEQHDDPAESMEYDDAGIVEKLRESTGAFRKQIEAAKRALESGDMVLYSESSEEDDAGHEEVTADGGDDSEDSGIELALDDESQEEQSDESDQSMDHSDPLSQTMIQAGIDPSLINRDNMETIIMEGEFVRDALEEARWDAERQRMSSTDEPSSLIDTYMLNKGRGGRRKGDPAGAGVIFGIVALLLLLSAQFLHASRYTLATYGAFNQTLGPVYRALGNPVTPEWNVKGWRFESTRGSTDEQGKVLTIFSNIGNASDQALPYPLVHVALTDRREEIIGSKVLEPSEYLAGDLDPRTPVEPGDRFTAVIPIESVSDEATGFKLNVCYRVSPGRVRCATEDFKN